MAEVTVRVHEGRDGIEVQTVWIGPMDNEKQVVIYPCGSFLSVQEVLNLHDLGVEIQTHA